MTEHNKKPYTLVHQMIDVLIIFVVIMIPRILYSIMGNIKPGSNINTYEYYHTVIVLLDIFVFGYAINMCIKTSMSRKEGKLTVGSIWLSGSFLALTILMMMTHTPLTKMMTPFTHTDRNIETGTLYLAYSPTCQYCEKSDKNMMKAVQTYNRTHSKPVHIVNLDKNTKLSKDISNKIKYKGSILKQTKDGTVKTIVYTTGDKHGPTETSAAKIYNALVDMSETK